MHWSLFISDNVMQPTGILLLLLTLTLTLNLLLLLLLLLLLFWISVDISVFCSIFSSFFNASANVGKVKAITLSIRITYNFDSGPPTMYTCYGVLFGFEFEFGEELGLEFGEGEGLFNAWI